MSHSRLQAGRLLVAALASCMVVPAWAGVSEVEGVTGQGALYAFFVPDGQDGDEWNDDLVLYSVGYVSPAAPVALPSIDGLRDAWLDLGYAVAYSSFSENGLVVKEGVQQTHQLRGLFKSEFGKPDRTYLVGHSQGGLRGWAS